ncbi:MAG: hypothetical protein HYY18_12355 [Planctomycetes bacterium]|nr:hypothetical protein [Planctomycetota bacterium]
MQPTLKLVTPEALDLHLRVTDPEVLAELVRRAESADRDLFALAALRVGVLAMKQAAGALDERALRDAGRELVAGLEMTLLEHRTKTAGEVAGELRRYLDTQTGSLPQMIDNLVKGGGHLDRLLRQHLGDETSTLAQTLTAHIGAQSPLLRMLSPEQKSGLLARLEELVKSSLEDQRARMLGEFDLNRPESALSRLLASISKGQGSLEENFRNTIGKLASEWSLDNEASSVARFRKGLTELIDRLSVEQRGFQQAVMKELAELRARRAVEQQTTRKGATFEEALGALLRSEAEKAREIFAAVGLNTGEIKSCKKGDFVLEQGPEAAAPGARVVVEAKDDRAYGVKEALAELEVARPNRRAQAGVFVFSRAVVPPEMARFQRHGSDLLVVWDLEDPASDLWLQAALEVARALLVRRARQDQAETAGLDELDRAIAQIEKDSGALQAIVTSAQTIGSAAGKIQDEAEKLQKKLARQVEAMREGLEGMRGGSAK